MKTLMIFMSVIAMVLAVPHSLYPQAGSLDPSFDEDGYAIFDFFNYSDGAIDIATFSDTSLLVCGATFHNWFMGFNKGFLLKLLPDGSRDANWGSNGQVIFPDTDERVIPTDMEIQTNGNILVCGIKLQSPKDIFILRYLPDGTPDTTFQEFPSLGSSSWYVCNDMALQPDGKIVLGGRAFIDTSNCFLFIRVNPDGSPDTTFGDMGVALIDAPSNSSQINSIGFLSSGAIVGVGYAEQPDPPNNDQVVMVKLNPDGSPMTSFAPDGYIFLTIFTDASSVNCVKVSNDSLFLTGWQENANNNKDLFLSKMDSSGVADLSFGSGGISLFTVNQESVGNDMFVNVDDKIYVCGAAGLDNSEKLLIVRYLSNGTLDPDFNGTGYVTTSINSTTRDIAHAIDLQVDGKIVCAGSTTDFIYYIEQEPDALVTRYLNDFTPCGCTADFTASTTHTCDSNAVTFTDQSVSAYGVIETWDWYFEGGTPSTSTVQNPTVTYLNTGHFDVQLIVSDWYDSDTLFRGNYITIASIPAQPLTPSGPSDLCGTHSATFSVNSLQFTDSYEWVCIPADAGNFTGNDTIVLFEASSTWTGMCQIKARGIGYCGDGPWSDAKEVEIHHSPELFDLSGNGWYCHWENGSEIILEGSETGVDYELYHDGNPTGNVVAGTGNAISFGILSQEGFYTAVGYTDFCSEEMTGQIFVYELPLPSQPEKADGDTLVCNYYQNIYSVDSVLNSDSLIWTLVPTVAGEVLPSGLEATVVWETSFTGLAELSCHGANACGEGPESDATNIEVFEEPEPEISGPTIVCVEYEEDYQTPYFSGSSYAWEVMGGDIVAGEGKYLVTVHWGEAGTGSLIVEELNMGGCSASSEIYEVIIEECTSLEERIEGEFIIYPNPASNFVHITFSEAGTSSASSLRIINTIGEVLFDQNIDKGKLDYILDVSSYVPGLYFIQLTDYEGVTAKWRIVIQ